MPSTLGAPAHCRVSPGDFCTLARVEIPGAALDPGRADPGFCQADKFREGSLGGRPGEVGVMLARQYSDELAS